MFRVENTSFSLVECGDAQSATSPKFVGTTGCVILQRFRRKMLWHVVALFLATLKTPHKGAKLMGCFLSYSCWEFLTEAAAEYPSRVVMLFPGHRVSRLR